LAASLAILNIVAVFNQKGGVGKTTTALNVAAALKTKGTSPLLIDLDPQASLTHALGLRNIGGGASLYGFFKSSRPLAELIRTHPSGIAIIPASFELSKVESLHTGDLAISRRLKEGLEPIARGRQILLDCSPALGVLSLNALLATDQVLLPVAADYLSLEGANKLSAALDVLEARLGKKFIRRVVITRFDARRKLAFEIQRRLQQRFGPLLCKTVIKENVSLAESPMRGKDIFSFAASSQGAADYKALTEELQASNFLSSAKKVKTPIGETGGTG